MPSTSASRRRSGLSEYRRKRRFDRTPEPRGGKDSKAGRAASSVRRAASRDGYAGRFVVHKHAARQLHYDLRLEFDGALLSWAVPKGPSLDPTQRRLAVQVEDHPLEYGEFEGIIPQGEYGGGTVMIWDRGRWRLAEDGKQSSDGGPAAIRKALEKGRLVFELEGERLRGRWNLVRTGGLGREARSWLLIKSRDEEAKRGRAADVAAADLPSVATGRSMEEIAEPGGQPITRKGERASAGAKARSAAAKKTSATAGRSATANGRAAGTRSSRRSNRAASPVRDRVSKLDGARSAPLPRRLSPQLATLVSATPEGEDWLHELKLDGYRVLCVIDEGEVRLMTRGGLDWAGRFPTIAEAASAVPAESAILDGELVVTDEHGVSRFQLLQNALRTGRKQDLLLYVFDLPYCEGHDLTRTPLLQRKETLQALLASMPAESPIRFSDHVVGQGKRLFDTACRGGLEGVISKRVDAVYTPGRSRTWVKTKCTRRQELVIAGYTDPSGSRVGFGALLLGYHDEKGRLIYAGRVGTGFDDALLRRLHAQLRQITRKTPAFDVPPERSERRGVHWTEPRLVAEVDFSEWTDDGRLRHPSFVGLREDKTPEEVVRERPVATELVESPQKAPRRRKARAAKATGKTSAASRAPARRRSRRGSPAPRTASRGAGGPRRRAGASRAGTGVTLSNPGRVLYADVGITKADLAAYYELVAERMLPHVVGRPLTLVRCPGGQDQGCFYQKHIQPPIPEGLRAVSIREKSGVGQYAVIDEAEGLRALAQLGTLEIHIWGCRVDDVERPDRIVFDLDPGPGVEWKDVIAAAREVRRLLTSVKLRSFVQTSGGKGLHVVAPLVPSAEWDEVRDFCEAIAREMEARDPKAYVANMSKAKRGGRIFIDYLRNGRGATSIAPYSTRARPGAAVAAPLAWTELASLKGADVYTIRSLPRRLRALKRDPWAGYFAVRQKLPRVDR